MKNLYDISWQVTEQEYRKDKAISYSTLSTFAREGIKGLKKISQGFTIDSSSLRHGSLVDTLLTDKENFKNLYVVSKFKMPTDQVKSIVDLIWKKSDKKINNLKKISSDLILECSKEIGYGGASWNESTIVKKIIEAGEEYFHLIPLTEKGITPITNEDYQFAKNCVNALYDNKYTKWLFSNLPNIKVYYQLKFKINFDDFNGIKPLQWKEELLSKNTIRCMFDIIVEDSKNKFLLPIDLKTTSHNEENFDLSIQDWYYDLQATKYSYILRQVCSQDDKYKDYKILPFCFLPINKFNLSPQFYEYKDSIHDLQKTFIDYKGQTHYPWYEYLQKTRWHFNNNEFNYDMETVLNNGKKIIKF